MSCFPDSMTFLKGAESGRWGKAGGYHPGCFVKGKNNWLKAEIHVKGHFPLADVTLFILPVPPHTPPQSDTNSPQK